MPGLAEWSPVETVEGSRVERGPSTGTRWFVAALALALLAVVGLGAWVYADHRQPSAQRQAIAAVQAWVDANNAHDLAAVWRVTTPDWQLETVGRNGHGGPWMGGDLSARALEAFKEGYHFALLGSPVALSGTKVEVEAHVTDATDDQTGVALFTLRQYNGALRVAELLWAT